MNNKIKTAVVGVGYLGTFHAEKYSTLENSELIAVVDVRKEQVDKISTKLNVKGLNDYKELKDLGVQAVSVAADTTKHFEIASWLLSNGIDVLLEKPIASNVEEAQKLVEIAETNQRILQVGHLERFNPAFIEMKRVLTKPWFFESKRISSFTGRGSDVDVVLDLMIHDIDIISHLVGRPLERVDAVGVPVLTKSVDIANARLIFEGGATANVTASRVSFKSERSMRIFQPDVYINLDFGNKKLTIFTKSSADPGATPQIGIKEMDIEERDALKDEISSFVECVKNKTKPLVSGEDGLKALLLVNKIREALNESLERFSTSSVETPVSINLN